MESDAPPEFDDGPPPDLDDGPPPDHDEPPSDLDGPQRAFGGPSSGGQASGGQGRGRRSVRPAPAPVRSSSGRVPPHNLDAEESLLGAMLLSRIAIDVASEVGS